MCRVSETEYKQIYQTTGIDIDGRRDLLQNHILPQIEICVKRFVTFVKAIPGFTQLPMEDQIALVKCTFTAGFLILSRDFLLFYDERASF